MGAAQAYILTNMMSYVEQPCEASEAFTTQQDQRRDVETRADRLCAICRNAGLAREKLIKEQAPSGNAECYEAKVKPKRSQNARWVRVDELPC